MHDIIQGNCLEVLTQLEDNSIDAIVTDPPYELGFMGKSWDNTGIANNPLMWAECLRVLRPGGHLLAFSGTRTYHRMAVAIEDAGFEVKNMITWCYGQGFPKSLRVGCNCDRGMLPYNNDKVSLSSEEKLLDLPQGVSVSKQVSNEKEQSLLKEVRRDFNIKNENWDKKETASDLQTLQERVLPEMDGKGEDSLLLSEVQWDSEVGASKKVLGKRKGNKKPKERIEDGKESSVERGSNLLEETRELQADKICEMSERISGNGSEGQLHNGTSFNNGDAPETDIDEDRSSASYQSRPTRQQDRESDAISEQQGTQTIRREICKKCGGVIGMEGYGTALKPAIEPICMAMKPISERTIRLNVLKWGTGGINIDESRVSTSEEIGRDNRNIKNSPLAPKDGWNENSMKGLDTRGQFTGRFPANLIHDNSEEVRECFPETKSGGTRGDGVNNSELSWKNTSKNIIANNHIEASSGNASRFFKSILYVPKASKSERNKGCEELEEKERIDYGGFHSEQGLINNNRNPENRKPTTNNHPTVKPIALMEYLIKMVTPKGGIVLDPFAGSGSTLVAAKQNGFQYVGIELDKDYCIIAESRLKQKTLKQEVLF